MLKGLKDPDDYEVMREIFETEGHRDRTCDRVPLNQAIVEALTIRIEKSSLPEEDQMLLKAVLRDHLVIGQAFKESHHTIVKLLRMIFGAKTEKADTVLDMPKVKKEKGKPKGHGRKSASAYTGARKITISPPLKPGDVCPQCEKGKVYPTEVGVTVRVTGNAPLDATVWDREKLRCNLCGEVFTPDLPEEAGDKKYDETAGAMIALLKYGTGIPFARLEELQKSLGIPLPASTQWDIMEKTAAPAHPAYRELIRQAAQGKIIHNDDTTMKILAAVNEGERSGTFTTGILSIAEGRKIALFFTGHKHAGENMTDLLRERHIGLDPPIQMCDGLARNLPKDFATVLANCLGHGRRNFVEIVQSFPEECRFVIETLAEVYKNDGTAKEEKMTPHQRLLYHQAQSGPLMMDLRLWMNGQFEEKKTEPNSGLGKAFSYMLKRWESLTLFLRVPGAPLDNNICYTASGISDIMPTV